MQSPAQAEKVERPTVDVTEWISNVSIKDLTDDVRRHARRSLLDLIGVAAAGRTTRNAEIVCRHVADHYGAGGFGARIPFDGRRVSLPGAAMAGATMIDSLDAHDGHRLTKGHAGVVILPVLLALCDEMATCTGSEFLTRFTIGYEIAVRAGIALHGSVDDYHTSGAWNAIGAAAVACRSLDLNREMTRHALGTAEYYGPRSQMMRCIDFPTMVKDGATYGAHVGITAALLAQQEFTGAPALTVEGGFVEEAWQDLGTVWRMTEQYLKPWPVCRWSQPAIQAAQKIRETIGERPIDRIEIETFEAATRLTATHPQNTEIAQYSLPFPVAAMLLHGKVDADTVTKGLDDKAVTALAEKVELSICPRLDADFPAFRKARLTAILSDGTIIESGVAEADGDPEQPMSDKAVLTKFHGLAGPRIGEPRAGTIAELVDGIETIDDLTLLFDAVLSP